ncbi:MAG: hypothetical protein D3910_13000 [Candidatus Electrothrix sp. ATG2]|nr:hypothetical protein [Candidatus Electrothrix sp. ATG2]
MSTTKLNRIINFMKQLLDCPFCGQKPEVDSGKRQGVEYWNVSCLNDACLVHVETDDFESIEKAILAWNTRVS